MAEMETDKKVLSFFTVKLTNSLLNIYVEKEMCKEIRDDLGRLVKVYP